MPDHAVFGGCLRSDIPFPELRSAAGTDPDWILRLSTESASTSLGEYLGQDWVDAGVEVRAFKHDGGFRLAYDDTGVFDVSSSGHEISWAQPPDCSLDAARLDILGRVLATALHASGTLCLHGSGVSISRRGIGFLAPKFSGKSTLAFALTAAGATLLTDDTLPVDPGPPAMAWPGVHSVRLFDDSAGRLSAAAPSLGDPLAQKHTLSDLHVDRLRYDRVPLDTIYLLTPVAADGREEPVRRIPLAGVESAVAILKHAKIGTLLGRSEAPLLFNRALAVARNVPVYTLEVVRDFDRLGTVVSQVMEWHGTLASAAADASQ